MRLFGADGIGCFRETILGLDHLVAGFLGLDLDFGKAILLGKAQGGSTRGIGAGDMAVPAIDGAVAGHKPLTGGELRHQGERIGFLDNANLAKGAGERCRCANMRDQGPGA